MINATGNRMTFEIKRQNNLVQNIARSQIEISTGKRIQQASDDPVSAARVANIRRTQANEATWSANLELGLSLNSQADSILRSANDNLARAKELLLGASNGGLSAADLRTIGLELSEIANQIDGLSATRSSLGEPLFENGVASEFRFSDSLAFSPVPTREATFNFNGNSLSQMIRGAASAVSVGDRPGIAAALASVDQGIDHAADISAEIGVRGSRMQQLLDSHKSREISLSAERSGLEDTNLTNAIAKLNAQTITLDAAQAAFARINRRTLIDILG